MEENPIIINRACALNCRAGMIQRGWLCAKCGWLMKYKKSKVTGLEYCDCLDLAPHDSEMREIQKHWKPVFSK